MISFDPISSALSKLKPPGADAMFLNQALALSKQGAMFQNPLNTSLNSLSSLNLGGLSSMLNSIPGGSDMAAKCQLITSKAAAVKKVSDQMFTKVLPTKASIPSSIMMGHPSLSSDDAIKITDFSIPSVTQIMSTAQSEQSANERLGISGSNPCSPVTKLMGATMSAANKLDGSILKTMMDSGSDAINAIQSAFHNLNNAIGDEIAGMQAVLSDAFTYASGALNDAINKISSLISDIGHAIVDSIKSVIESAEKAMHVATADMVKSLVQSSPCMRDVLSPGSNVYTATCEITLVNVGSALGNTASLLYNRDNIVVTTTMLGFGYDTWQYSLNFNKISNLETTVRVNLEYTIDMTKAKLSLTTPLDSAISNVTSISLRENDTTIGSILVNLRFSGLGTPTVSVSSVGSGSNNIGDLDIVGKQVEWLWSKKQSMLSKDMQDMTAPVDE